MCKKGYSRLWMLRRLKRLGASSSDMLDVFYKQIRCVLELAVSVWVPGLTQAESFQIERVQKCALHVILGDDYGSYNNAVSVLEVDKLSVRRSNLCLNFARRSEKNPKYQNWFCPAEEVIQPTMKTRSDKEIIPTNYRPVPYRTERYKGSPIPYLTDLLNEYHAKQK